MPAVRLVEWQAQEPEPGSPLFGLRLAASDRAAARTLVEAGRVSIDELAAGLRITATSWVGRVAVGDLSITIEPKLAKGPLLALVRYAYGLRDVERAGAAAFTTSGTLLPDLLAAQLFGEVSDLLARGLPRRYVERRELLASPRGRIDVGALARRGGPAIALPCAHHPRSADHLLLQALRAGVDVAASATTDPSLRVALRRLGARLAEEVSSVALTREAVARAARGLRRTELPARAALELVGLLLEGQGVTLDDGTEVRLPGFLFDMNRFFQALVGRWLREHLPACRVMDEKALVGLLAYAPGYNPRNVTAPRPRPDFAVQAKGRPIVLLDAKYRDLWVRPLPREMLYQLALYATSGAGDPLAVILYPTDDAAASEARIELHDVVTGAHRAGVALRPVHLPTIAALAVEGDVAARERVARALAFGPAG